MTILPQLDDPTLNQIYQEQQGGQGMIQQAGQIRPGYNNWSTALAQALQGYLGGRLLNQANQRQQDLQQQKNDAASQLMDAYTQATRGGVTPATDLDSNGMPTPTSQPEQVTQPDPQRAQSLLMQAMMSNDPRMQKWGAITLNNTPRPSTPLTDQQIAADFDPTDFTPESWAKFTQSRNMGDLVGADDPSTEGKWGKAPDGRNVWMGPKGSVQFEPNAKDEGGGGQPLATQRDPVSGMFYFDDAKGNHHFIPGQLPDQNRADEANTMLSTLNDTGNMIASMEVPGGLVGKVATGAEKLGDMLGSDDTSRQALENNINMLRQGMINQLTGSRRQPNKQEQATVDNILPQYSPLTTRAGMIEHLKGAESWIQTRNSGSLWRSQGRPGFTPAPAAQSQPAAPGSPGNPGVSQQPMQLDDYLNSIKD